MPIFAYISDSEKKAEWDLLLKHHSFWKEIDVFLFQKNLETNRFYRGLATDNIIAMLSENCQKVKILNIYFSGYFVQTTKNDHNLMQEIHQSGLFPYGDKFVDEMVKHGLSEEDIIKRISRIDFIEPRLIRSTIKHSLSELRKRELDVDVIISDYIAKYYDKQQLFYSFNHPTNSVLIEYAKRIIKYLNLKNTKIDETAVYVRADTLRGVDIPIYPAVQKELKSMRGGVKLYFINRYIDPELLVDFKEYYRKYIRFCYQ